MSTSSASVNRCPKCGAALPSAATAGLCPRCLMAEAMAPTQSDAEASPRGKTLSPAELAPHFPQLEILECLGRGGMGVVYKARQKLLNRLVALKLLAPERVADAAFAQRFTQEAQALATLNHPTIVTIYDFGRAGGFYFLLMEFVDGVNLRQAMKAGRFTPEQALSVVPPVCEALQYAHEHGIIHRDIKPENLLLDKEGRVKIADFGIAKMLGEVATIIPSDKAQTESTKSEGTLASAAGTPQYMAPEQKAHCTTDHRADIYSLGVVLYELLTGELPADKLQPPSRKVQIDVRLDEIVLRALEVRPELRYQTAGEFRTQVETVVATPREVKSVGSAKPDGATILLSPPRFSRAAIFAAGWITLSIFVVPPFLWHEVKTHEFERGGPFGNLLSALVFFAFLLPAFTAPVGATILGWIGVAQIRRSAGKLYGLGLAVADGILFPLLALTGLIAWFWWWVFRALLYPHQIDALRIDGRGVELSFASRFVGEHWTALIVICTLMTTGPLCLFIIWRVWRAVNRPSANSGTTAPAGLRESASSPLAYAAMFFALSSVILASWIWSGMLAPSRLIVFSILVSALFGVALALPVRRTTLGKRALQIGSMNSGIWVIFAIAGLGAQIKHAAAPRAPVPLTFGPVIEREVVAAIDFDSGKLANFPTRSSKSGDAAKSMIDNVMASIAWAESEGMDAVLDTSDSFVGLGLKVEVLENDTWEKLTATEVRQRLAATRTKFSQPLKPGEKQPPTYAFQTREGSNGLLQVIGFTDKAVKLRYKLVQGDAAQAAAVVKPATAAVRPTFGPVIERVLPSGVPCREQYFQFHGGEVFVVGNGPGTSKEEAAFDEKRIDDAGGVDMSAGSWEEGISIAGRGCFFTQDVEGLKWDSITAEQVMERLKYVSSVNGVVEPRMKDFPTTYLFKTARGEVGIMEVLGVVDDQRDGWKEKGMKFRYKLVQGTGATATAVTTRSSLVFGPETRGLQAAIEVTPGEPFKLRIHVRNVSDRGISIGGALYRQDDECLLTDAQGQPVPVTKATHDIKVGMKGGYFGTGQVAVFESAGLSFQDIDKVPASVGYVAKASPGRYTLRFRFRLPGDDVPFAAGERDWKGELETGPATIEVKEPVAPIADSPSSAILGPVVERVVNDLQTTRENCALSFDSGKLLPVPANITLDTLTNPSAQPVAVAWARDNQVDGVAFVTIDAGKIVKCGLLCPGLVVLRANNPEWVWDSPTPRELKEEFDKAMHEWKELPHIAVLTSDGNFPANYMILDTRTRRRGVLQIMGIADNPRGVKIRYRMVEGAAVKKISQTAIQQRATKQ